MAERLISGESQPEDVDLSLRPRSLDDFVGQGDRRLEAARGIDHVADYGVVATLRRADVADDDCAGVDANSHL